MAFANLPGVLVNTIDGGLAARRTPRNKSTLVIGTAGSGPADVPYQVTDRAKAAADFGFSGNLLQASEEVSTFSDNVILYRMGSKPMVLTGVGRQLATSTPISNVGVASNIATITSIAHGLTVGVGGQTVIVAAVTNTTVNGTFTVLTVPSTSVFTYAVVAVNAGPTADTGTVVTVVKPGFSITFGTNSITSQTDYKIYYTAGVLAVWLNNQLVRSTSVSLGIVDTGDISLSLADISGQTGVALNGGVATPALANAISVQAGALVNTTPTLTPSVVLTQPSDGTGMSGRQIYVALVKALDLLGLFPVDQVYCPSVLADELNVAHYVATDPTTVANLPTSGNNALDWLKTTVDAFGNKVYQWASDVLDSNLATVTAMTAVTPATRIAAGFYEVHPIYALANFCRNQELTTGGCLAIIGTSAPVSYRLADTRTWVGFLPIYSSVGTPTASGSGLLGLPELVGSTIGRLNTLTSDFAQGFRLPGYFQTVEQQYDGSPVVDRNQNKVDIGAYVHVAADQAGLSNAFKSSYAGSIAGMVAGYLSGLDEKRSLTNKPFNVIQLWKPAMSQLDSLKFANVNVLRFKTAVTNPVLLHGDTVANSLSDYTSLLRQRIKFLVVSMVRQEAEAFIGESSIDGLQLASMKTALEARAIQLQKRGYISNADFNISTTVADQRIGHAQIDITFNPADELVQLNAFIAVSRR